MTGRKSNNFIKLMSKVASFLSLISIIFIYSLSSNAQSMTDFIRTFSGICFQTLGNIENARAILKYQKWEAMDEDMLSMLGRPANSEAVLEGYFLKRNAKGKGYILGLTTLPSTTQVVCSLIPGADEDYTENVGQLVKCAFRDFLIQTSQF